MRISETGSGNIGSPRQGNRPDIATHCRDLLDAFPAVAYACDAAGLITYYNYAAPVVWGRTPQLNDPEERYCGSHRLYLADGTPIRHDECWMALALMNGIAYHGHEIVIERCDGTRTIGEAYAHPLRSNAGRIVGGLNLVVDITHLRSGAPGLRRSDPPAIAYSALRVMIDVAVSMLSLMPWEERQIRLN